MGDRDYCLSCEQERRLLSLAMDAGGDGAADEDGWDQMDVVLELLANKLPERLEVRGEHDCGGGGFLRGLAGKTVGEMISDAETEIGRIIQIKDEYKKRFLFLPADSSGLRNAVRAVYYAAIAHGLVYGGRLITSLSLDVLERSFAVFAESAAVPEVLRGLFRKACVLCGEK